MTTLFDRVNDSFVRQGMMQHLGARVERVEPGLVEIVLPYSDKVTQQQGGFHGGAIGAVADIAAGYAGLTVAPEGMEVVTVEYKINFLASFQGGELRAVGRVLKGGKRIIVTAAEVLHMDASGKTSTCALMQQTLAPVPKTY
ncbi:MAG: hypothetical protein RJA34_3026 [Pseudomonadota bacterium]|jgi:uncharacterized protein (TIGR00369 family)